jgi:hypothetical protein
VSARGRVARPALLTCAALLRATLAHAESARSEPVVVLLGPSAEATREVLLRVQGELTADGFRVELLRRLAPPEREDLVRDRCGTWQGSIVAGLFVDGRTGDVEMLFCDPTSRHQAVRSEHPPVSPAGNPPEAVARHAVDLLRAALLDFAVETIHLAGRPAPEHTMPPAPPPPAPERAASGLRSAIELGAGMLVGFGGLDPSIMPLLRLRFGLERWLQLRVTGAGLGTTPTVGTARGSATVAQAFGVADVALILAPSTWLRPLVVLGAGAYGATVSGTGQAPYSGVTSGGMAFAVDGGIGVAPSITVDLSIAVEASVIYAVPAMEVRFLDVEAARLGQPILLLSVGIAEWL